MTLVISLILAALASATHRPPPPCYVIVTAIVSTSNPYTVRRIVTSGIQRHPDSGNGSPSYCTPADGDGAAAAQHAVDARIYDSPPAGNLEHVVVHTTSPDVAGIHLKQLVATVRPAPNGFKGVEVVTVKSAGTPLDTIPLPELSSDPRVRASCADDNAALTRAGASFHWAC